MPSKPSVQDFMVAAIKRTRNPLAPVVLEEMFNSIESCMRMLVPIAEQEKTVSISRRLMSPFTDVELEAMAPSPDFIVAVMEILKQSLLRFPH